MLCQLFSRIIDIVYWIQYTIYMSKYKIKFLICKNGSAPIIDWLNSLDSSIRKRINQRILRLEDCNFGDYKKLSSDISELRFTIGKGYRIYYTELQNVIVLLINGGDKAKQSKDIKKAQELLKEWRLENE